MVFIWSLNGDYVYNNGITTGFGLSSYVGLGLVLVVSSRERMLGTQFRQEVKIFKSITKMNLIIIHSRASGMK